MEGRKVLAYARREARRQKMENLTLIASENAIYPEALRIARLPLADKYSEGYPGRRFYNGCRWIDRIEEEAIAAAKKLFNCNFANVQCYSGSIANLAIYRALLRPGDVILGMEMSSGGHLTHGSPHSSISYYYTTHSYTVDPSTFLLDYDSIRKIAIEVRPKLIIAGASSYPFHIDFEKFKKIADEVGAYLLADICHLSGMIATGLHQHCFPHADVAMCTTHKQLRGYRGALILWNDEKFTTPINKAVFPGIQGGMNPSAVAINAHCLSRDLEEQYSKYMRSVVQNAKMMALGLREKGAVVLGTDTHLFLVDTRRSFGMSGKDAADLLEVAGYITNANLVPFDAESSYITSGIRIGTLYLTTLEPTPEDVEWISEQIYGVLRDGRKSAASRAKKELVRWLRGKRRRYYEEE